MVSQQFPDRSRETLVVTAAISSQGRMRVPHSLFVDDCADAVYVADRDAGAVHRIQIRGEETGGEILILSPTLTAYDLTCICHPSGISHCLAASLQTVTLDCVPNTRCAGYPAGCHGNPRNFGDPCTQQVVNVSQLRLLLARAAVSGTWDLSQYGRVYSVAPGPYGTFVAGCWDVATQQAHVVHVNPHADGEHSAHSAVALALVCLSLG